MCLFKTFSNLLRKEEKDDNINQLAEFKTTFVILIFYGLKWMGKKMEMSFSCP